MREIVTLQIGQCGNQIGHKFYQNLQQNNSLFYNKKARSILIDTEDSVVERLLTQQIYDKDNMICEGIGAGNNFAQGYFQFGNQLENQILEKLRKEIEKCNSIQSLIIFHSLGGGTGSGLGSYTTKLINNEYDINIFNVCVISNQNDVVTSPYNNLLSLNQLIQYSDCILPFENDQIIQQYEKQPKESYFQSINNHIAKTIRLMITSNIHPGELNIDMNEIPQNLIPFKFNKFIVSSFHDQTYQLVNQKYQSCKMSQSEYFSCLFYFNQSQNYLKKMEKMKLKMNQHFTKSIKIGLTKNIQETLFLSNNIYIYEPLKRICEKFNILYSKKAFLHHYTNYCEEIYMQQQYQDVLNMVKNNQEFNLREVENLDFNLL